MTWSFTACPINIIEYYCHMLKTGLLINPALSIRGMGRVLVEEINILEFYRLLEKNKKLSNNYLAAAKDILFFRKNAAALLNDKQSLHLLRNARAVLSAANEERKYKIKFMTSIGLIGALLRFRVVEANLLVADRDSEAKPILDQLASAAAHLKGIDAGKVDIIRSTIEFIKGTGGNPGLLAEIQNAEEDNADEEASEDD